MLRDKIKAMSQYVSINQFANPNIIQNIIIPDLLITSHKVFSDNRGETEAPFVFSDLEKILGFELKIAQTTRSRNFKTKTGRGLHTAPYAKITECVKGKVKVVVVDLRENSPSFLKVAVEELEYSNGKSLGKGLYVPGGCAHAYVTLTEGTEYQYVATGAWTPDIEVGFSLLDPMITKALGFEVEVLSDKDKANVLFKDVFPDKL